MLLRSTQLLQPFRCLAVFLANSVIRICCSPTLRASKSSASWPYEQLKSDLQSFLGRNDIDPSSPCPGSLSRLFKHGVYLVVVMLGVVVKHH